MARQGRTTLKTYFETGDTPTEAQFVNLIDSVFSLDEDVLIYGIALSGKDTDIEADTAIATSAVPEDWTYSAAFVTVSTAPTGSSAIWDINVNAATVLSTKITITAGNTDSLSGTQPVFSTASNTQGQLISIDCDQIGATIAGQNAVLYIIYTKS